MTDKFWTTRTIATIGTLLLLTGCSATRNANFGIRPVPEPFSENEAACTRFENVLNYTQDLQEAYHSRATQNRWWIYVAGTLGLGTIAATGGLAAAGGATLSIALLSISGGFSSGFFAFLDNAGLAQVYTISANQLAEGLRDAEAKIVYDDDTGKPTSSSCASALVTLEQKLTTAQTELESARSDAAAAAILRAKAEADNLKQLSQEVEDASLKRAVQGGRIIEAVWPAEGKASVTISGADLSKVKLSDFQVKVGDTTVPAASLTKESVENFVVSFEPPPEPADTPADGREISLVFPSADATIGSLPNVRLKKKT